MTDALEPPVTRWTADLFVRDAGTLTECPRWDDRAGRLFWVDIYAGTLNSCDAEGNDLRRAFAGLPLGSYAPREGAGHVLALETGFALSAGDVAAWTPVGSHRALPSTLRANEGACDPSGRFYAGTMGHDEEPHAGALYRLDPPTATDPDPVPVVVVEGTTISNGIDWSADGRRAYYIDSADRRVDVFAADPSDGSFSDRRPFVDCAGFDGLPDGLTLDADDHVWVAFWDGGVVRRFSPTGRLVGEVRLPVARLTSCTFGGANLTDLFVTTAAHQLSADERAREPLSGSIFRCRPGITGHPVRRYAG